MHYEQRIGIKYYKYYNREPHAQAGDFKAQGARDML
jgi:hypothetical protein